MSALSGAPRWADHLAPAPLDLVQQFVNSHAYSRRPDELAGERTARTWLTQRGFDASPSRRERDRLIAAREALRGILRTHTAQDHDEAIAAVVAALPDARFGWRVENGSIRLVGLGTGVDVFVGSLAGAIATACLTGDWRRLKVCENDECAVAFWDRTRNHSSRFCSSEVCANRERQRRFRIRSAPA